MLYGRANLTAVSLGIHQAILEETTRFASERIRYGKPLHDLPTVKLKLGQMQSRLMTARLAAYHAVHLLDQGMSCDAELMNAKLVNVESAIDSGRNAMEIHAAAGLFTDRAIERYLRDAHHIFAPAKHLRHPAPAPGRGRPRPGQGQLVGAALRAGPHPGARTGARLSGHGCGRGPGTATCAVPGPRPSSPRFRCPSRGSGQNMPSSRRWICSTSSAAIALIVSSPARPHGRTSVSTTQIVPSATPVRSISGAPM